MNKNKLFLLLGFFLFSFQLFANEDNILRVMTFNLREAHADGVGTHYYLNRRPLVEKIINGEDDPELAELDFVALQEDNWFKFYEAADEKHPDDNPWFKHANASLAFTDVGNNNLRILYNSDKWQLQQSHIETLHSREVNNWGPRYFLWGQFSNINTGQVVNIINYHGFVGAGIDYDHSEDFNKMAEFIRAKQAANEPVIFMGDLNPSFPDLLRVLKPLGLSTTEGECTFNGWSPEGCGQFDYILRSDKLTQLEHLVIKKSYDNILPSDHYPVYEKLSVNN